MYGLLPLSLEPFPYLYPVITLVEALYPSIAVAGDLSQSRSVISYACQTAVVALVVYERYFCPSLRIGFKFFNKFVPCFSSFDKVLRFE